MKVNSIKERFLIDISHGNMKVGVRVPQIHRYNCDGKSIKSKDVSLLIKSQGHKKCAHAR